MGYVIAVNLFEILMGMKLSKAIFFLYAGGLRSHSKTHRVSR